MNKPNIDIPSGFAENGTKEDFPNDKILNGFDPINPDILPGDCLNKFIDDTYKGLNGVLELYEGCVLYDSTVVYTNKSLVFNITNDEIKFYHSLQNGNINHLLTDTDYWEEVNLGGSSRNIGEIVPSTLPLSDAGLHLLDGALIDGNGIYSAFVDYIANLHTNNPNANYFTDETTWQSIVNTYGSCGKFVYDTTNNTVRLPKISNILQGTTDINALSDLVEAGLPALTISSVGNHTHTADTNGKHSHTTTLQVWRGADGNTARAAWDGGDTRVGTGTESATTSEVAAHTHTINGAGSHTHSVSWTGHANTSTVQPQTIKVLYYIVISNSTKTQIEVDIDEIATDLNGKADTDLTNVTDTGYIKMAGASMPSGRYVDLTLGADGATYTAPADGWVTILRRAQASGEMVQLYDVTSRLGTRCAAPQGNFLLLCFLPVSRGATFVAGYTATGGDTMFRFIYAVGSESEAS